MSRDSSQAIGRKDCGSLIRVLLTQIAEPLRLSGDPAIGSGESLYLTQAAWRLSGECLRLVGDILQLFGECLKLVRESLETL
jgi:hypothetical protein